MRITPSFRHELAQYFVEKEQLDTFTGTDPAEPILIVLALELSLPEAPHDLINTSTSEITKADVTLLAKQYTLRNIVNKITRKH